MKKRSIFNIITASSVSAMIIGGGLNVQAASPNDLCSQLQQRGAVFIGNTSNLDEIRDQLGQMGINVNIGDLLNCAPVITPRPECPVVEIPETECPAVEIPETECPAVEIPETECPEINAPETEAPETSTPETETPETNIPETSVPETEDEGSTESSFAEQVVKLVNQERAKNGLNPVTLDKTIEAAGLVRAKEIAVSFSHTRPNGSSFSTVLKEQGISYRGAGENIAMGYKTPEAVMEAWMNSDGHRANILNKNFTEIGVGHYQSEDGKNHWTQLFTY
jgi:uncharacterized protein YkwD